MDTIYDAVTLLMDTDVGKVTEGDIEDLALRLDALKRTQAIAKELQAAVELQLLEVLPEEPLAINGVGMLRRRRKKSSRVTVPPDKVKNDLTVAVARTMGRDPYTGEIDDDRRNIARETMELATKCISIGGSSLTKAAPDLIGISSDEFKADTWTDTVELLAMEEEA